MLSKGLTQCLLLRFGQAGGEDFELHGLHRVCNTIQNSSVVIKNSADVPSWIAMARRGVKSCRRRTFLAGGPGDHGRIDDVIVLILQTVHDVQGISCGVGIENVSTVTVAMFTSCSSLLPGGMMSARTLDWYVPDVLGNGTVSFVAVAS